MKRWAWSLVAFAVLACGGDSSGPGNGDGGGNEPPPEEPPQPPTDPGLAEVVVVEGSVERDEFFSYQRVTLHLSNEGGPGVYKLEVWGLPTSSNPEETFMGETEPVEVGEEYEETLTYDVGTASFADYVLVFSRHQGSAQYRETDRFEFPE